MDGRIFELLEAEVKALFRYGVENQAVWSCKDVPETCQEQIPSLPLCELGKQGS